MIPAMISRRLMLPHNKIDTLSAPLRLIGYMTPGPLPRARKGMGEPTCYPFRPNSVDVASAQSCQRDLPGSVKLTTASVLTAGDAGAAFAFYSCCRSAGDPKGEETMPCRKFDPCN